MAVALMPSLEQGAGLLGAAAVGVVMVSLVKIRTLAFCWGVLLPIYGVSGLGSTVFDVARLAGAAALIVRCRSEGAESATMNRWAMPLWLVGGLILIDGATAAGGDIRGGAFMLLSTTIAFLLCRRRSLSTPILAGFAVGAVASAAVLLMQVMEMPTIALPLQSYGRFPGLSNNTPRASTELALACVLLFTWAQGESRRNEVRIFSAFAAIVCAAALLASGGRTGLAGLGLAVVVALRHRIIRLKHVLGIGAAVWLIFHFAEKYQLDFSTVDRLTEDQPDITAGRGVIFDESLKAFQQHPLLGVGYAEFNDRFLIMPHFVPLTYAVSVGLAGAAIGMYLLVRLAWVALGPRSGMAETMSPMLAAVFLVMSALEPDGPFVAVGMLTVLFIACRTNEENLYGDVRKVASQSSPGSRPANRPSPNSVSRFETAAGRSWPEPL